MTEDQHAPRPARTFLLGIFVALFVLTAIMVFLSFPAGLYSVFSGRLSNVYNAGSQARLYLWLGPVPAWLPFEVPLGGLFLVLTAVYAGMFLFGLRQQAGPVSAIRDALATGVSALLSSPFLVILVSIGFLNFSAVLISALSEAVAGPVGNPFTRVDPLLELGSLNFAPLREELGFRVVLIGVVALVLSIGRAPRDALKALWRPSAAYQGLAAGAATATIIWLATAASAATFGVCHVACGGGNGWNWSKLPEATWGGVVLGYLYVRYGFHVAVLTHWGVNYLGSSFSFFGQAAYGVSLNSSPEFIGQYLVDLDMILLFGLVSFILVAYLGIRKLSGRRRPPEAGFVDKAPSAGGAPGT